MGFLDKMFGKKKGQDKPEPQHDEQSKKEQASNLADEVGREIAQNEARIAALQKEADAYKQKAIDCLKADKNNTETAKRFLAQKKEIEKRIGTIQQNINLGRNMLSNIENAQDKRAQEDLLKRYNQIMELIKVDNDEYLDLIAKVNEDTDDLQELEDAVKGCIYNENDEEVNAELQTLIQEVDQQKAMEVMGPGANVPSVPVEALSEEEQLRRELGISNAEPTAEENAEYEALRAELGL